MRCARSGQAADVDLLDSPDGRAVQDSTSILEQLEAAHPEPSLHPDQSGCRRHLL
jgi:glutathione S-transferase